MFYDDVRALNEFSQDKEVSKLDKMSMIVGTEVQARAAKGDTNVLFLMADFEALEASLDDVRQVMREFRSMGFDVTPSIVKGSFWVDWGDIVDNW